MKKPFFDDFRELNSRTTGYRTAKADRFFIYLPFLLPEVLQKTSGFFHYVSNKVPGYPPAIFDCAGGSGSYFKKRS